ncbi:major facilitator superfamily domain-containing protein 1-like isoform X2 [Sitodiplosis mosellana]|uniref:major facilitator superfamily domain-containing protein 1-like isoform X2 n=1 Tax=Sitodiplosis mosellana TaxID=263140 RepID=UPI002444F3C9|nr:major facilitator superfamily domain-containing protein 1-like isoform X2 [Sitodiplosis mosellana]
MSGNDDLSTLILDSDEDDEENRQTSNDDELNAGIGFGGSTCHRFIALILMSLIAAAPIFCSPGPLQNYFMKDLDLSTTQYVWLSSINIWPNVVICFLGGFLIDRVFGVRFGTILYSFIMMVGQLIVSIGVMLGAFRMILLGRFILGIGEGSIGIAQRNYGVLWFKDKELNMVFGIMSSIALGGGTIHLMMIEPLYKYINQWYTGHMCLGVVMLIVFTPCLMSFICAILLGALDKRAQRILQRNDNPGGDIAKLSDVKTFNATFWMIISICIASNVAVNSFMALSKMFFMQKYDFSAQDANYINSTLCLISAVACPLFGYIIDKTGKNIYWMLISILALITAHSLFAFTYVNPLICMILMGLAILMLSFNVTPLIALVVPAYQLGTAFGFVGSAVSLILSVNSMFIGTIVDCGGYFTLEIFCICWSGVALTGTVVFWIYDAIKNGILNMTPHERELRLAVNR